jgi:hypothetical protein
MPASLADRMLGLAGLTEPAAAVANLARQRAVWPGAQWPLSPPHSAGLLARESAPAYS